MYNLIVNIDVLEHIVDYKTVIKNFYRLLKIGGYIYIHTPQPNQKRIFKQFEKWHHEDHVREGFTPEELRIELKRLGFRIIEMKETFGFFGKLAWELNHFTLKKSFVLAGLFFPFFYCLAEIDLLFNNKGGLGTAILAKKRNIT
jgi:2-polyprenyl-3-methyl-5-hydroxy-6-metoxy-1,4-benzoquinol methylase